MLFYKIYFVYIRKNHSKRARYQTPTFSLHTLHSMLDSMHVNVIDYIISIVVMVRVTLMVMFRVMIIFTDMIMAVIMVIVMVIVMDMAMAMSIVAGYK